MERTLRIEIHARDITLRSGISGRSSWLYDKLKGHVHPERRDEKVIIERTEVELEEGAINRVITEKPTSEKKSR